MSAACATVGATTWITWSACRQTLRHAGVARLIVTESVFSMDGDRAETMGSSLKPAACV
jgi:hypothetical protein